MDKKRIVKCVIDENGMLGLTAMGLVDVPAIEENVIRAEVLPKVVVAIGV